MSLITDNPGSTHLYVGRREEGLIKQITVIVELGTYNGPNVMREAVLDTLDHKIRQVLLQHFKASEISDITLHFKKTLTHLP